MQRGEVCYPEGKRQSERLKPGVLRGAEQESGGRQCAAAGAVRAAGRPGLGLRSGRGVRPRERS